MTISWIQSSLAWYFAACLQCLVWRFQYQELYTRSSFDRWVDFRFNSWRCDSWDYGRSCPSSRLYRSNIGGTVSAMCVPSYIGVLLLSCLCIPTTYHRWSWNRRGCSSNRCSRWDNRYSSFYGYRYYELDMATHWLEGRWKKETSKTLCSWWFYPWISFTLPSIQQWLSPNTVKTWLGFDDETRTMPSYGWFTGWKPSLQSVYTHVEVLPSW